MDKFSISSFRQAKLPSENDVMASWTGSKLVVSVICTTFNHEKYIEDAICGFLIQRTNFPFEVVIHDDASTDNSRSIINRYAVAYPTIIRTVFQDENQYSKGVMMLLHAASYAIGDYIAFCEGDDYWISDDKLQIQFDSLKEVPSCEICFHSAIKTTGEVPHDLLFCRRAGRNGILDVGSIIRCGGSFMPTASMLIRKSFFDRIFQDTGTFYKRNLDAYFFQIFCALSGGALYIDRPMSVYRSFAEGSWTEKILKDQNFYIHWLSNHLIRLHEADAMTGNRYTADFSVAIKRSYLSALNNINLDLGFRRDYYIEHRKELGVLGAVLWYCIFRIPFIHTIFIKARSFINNRLKQGLI